jgi:hypothetical protein
MSLNDFAVQLYLTLLAIAATPILLSWGLRRIAGKHAPSRYPNPVFTPTDGDLFDADEGSSGGLVRSSYNPNSTGHNIWVEAD